MYYFFYVSRFYHTFSFYPQHLHYRLAVGCSYLLYFGSMLHLLKEKEIPSPLSTC